MPPVITGPRCASWSAHRSSALHRSVDDPRLRGRDEGADGSRESLQDMNSGERVQNIVLGDVEVIRVIEWHEPFLPTTEFLPEVAAGVWTQNADWLAPDHWQPEADPRAAHSGALRQCRRTGSPAKQRRIRPRPVGYLQPGAAKRHNRPSNPLLIDSHAATPEDERPNARTAQPVETGGRSWRWRRDLNPRTGVTRHTLSRRAP